MNLLQIGLSHQEYSIGRIIEPIFPHDNFLYQYDILSLKDDIYSSISTIIQYLL